MLPISVGPELIFTWRFLPLPLIEKGQWLLPLQTLEKARKLSDSASEYDSWYIDVEADLSTWIEP